jgi:hypothetical protein
MSFIRSSKYEDNLSNINESLDKIDDSLYIIEVELEEIEEIDSNEEIQLLKNQIEERIEAIRNNKEEIYELCKLKLKKQQELQKQPKQQEQEQELPEINIKNLITSNSYRPFTKETINKHLNVILNYIFEKEETRQLLLSLLPNRREILENILYNHKFLSQDNTTEEINDKIYDLINHNNEQTLIQAIKKNINVLLLISYRNIYSSFIYEAIDIDLYALNLIPNEVITDEHIKYALNKDFVSSGNHKRKICILQNHSLSTRMTEKIIEYILNQCPSSIEYIHVEVIK